MIYNQGRSYTDRKTQGSVTGIIKSLAGIKVTVLRSLNSMWPGRCKEGINHQKWTVDQESRPTETDDFATFTKIHHIAEMRLEKKLS